MADLEEEQALAGEAEAQSQQTVMPWFLGALGLLAIAGFVAWLVFGAQSNVRQPPAAAPLTKPITQTT